MTAPARDQKDEGFEQRWLPPPLRKAPDDTEDDQKRTLWASQRWESQDAAYRLRDRDIEENCRMLAGQHWWVYHHLLGWQDISHWMTDEEKRWRQRPVFHRILPWYILTHARMTENPFICTFLPGQDHKDVELAEVMDALYKLKWREAGMIDSWARNAAWMIAAGTGFQQTRIDLDKGDFEEWVGKARLALVDGEGSPILGADGQPIHREIPEGVPFNEKGEPQAVLRPDGLQITGKPHRERRGDIVVDTLSPLECRGQWGPRPWHEQKIHMLRSYLTPQEVWERWQVKVEPDITDLPSGNAGFMERLLFGSGFYGASSTPVHPHVTGATSASQADGYSLVQTTWLAPSKMVEGMEETQESPGGRLLITTKNKVLADGPRPAKFKYTSPIRCFEFVRLPGRPWGSTPLEVLKSPQKMYNQTWKQIAENNGLTANPQQVYDLDSGLRSDQIDNRPGRQYGVRRRKANVPPIEWIRPPEMGSGVWRQLGMLQGELAYIGSQSGMDAAQRSSKRASGELIKELRFDDDRFLGPTMKRCAEESGRMIEDWRALFRVLYTTETILRYGGEDNAARTLVLLPEVMQDGDCSVVPDMESMLPEGRGERRQRVYMMWKDGAFGEPKSPGALRMLHDLGRFPNMSLTAVPGGVHRAAARQENMAMLAGREPVIHEWQDHEVHLDAHEQFMSAPEWERQPDPVKALFIQHRTDTMLAMVNKQRNMAALAAMAAAPPQGALPPGGVPPQAGAPAGGPPMPAAQVAA